MRILVDSDKSVKAAALSFLSVPCSRYFFISFRFQNCVVGRSLKLLRAGQNRITAILLLVEVLDEGPRS
jgi:hypothetical protein